MARQNLDFAEPFFLIWCEPYEIAWTMADDLRCGAFACGELAMGIELCDRVDGVVVVWLERELSESGGGGWADNLVYWAVFGAGISLGAGVVGLHIEL